MAHISPDKPRKVPREWEAQGGENEDIVNGLPPRKPEREVPDLRKTINAPIILLNSDSNDIVKNVRVNLEEPAREAKKRGRAKGTKNLEWTLLGRFESWEKAEEFYNPLVKDCYVRSADKGASVYKKVQKRVMK